MIKDFLNYRPILSFIAVALALTGCDQIKRGLGLERHQPDEFNVVDRPPLSMPPSMALKPPAPAERGAGAKESRQKVQDLVLKPPAATYMAPSKAEEDLLNKSGADKNLANIRAVIDQESNVTDKRERGLAEDMVFWKKESKPTGDVIDPTSEKKRLDSTLSKTSENAR